MNNQITKENLPCKKTTRMSNFELLRIICMILIIAHHFAVHSYFTNQTLQVNTYLIKALSIGGKFGVNVYVMITGYFMITSSFKLKKLLKLVLQTIFYSVMIYFAFCISGIVQFNFKSLVYEILAIYTNSYWFITSYIILYILSPYLNKMIKNCSFKELVILILVLLAIQLRIPRVDNYINFHELIWFVTLYIIAAFIKLYPNKIFNNNKIILPLSILSFLIMLIGVIDGEPYSYICHIICFISSASTFCLFKNIKISNCKFINLISSTTLGIYLIHDNKFVRAFLWNKWLNNPFHATLSNFYIFAFTAILVIFISCVAIDLLRQLLDKGLRHLLKNRSNQNSEIQKV